MGLVVSEKTLRMKISIIYVNVFFFFLKNDTTKKIKIMHTYTVFGCPCFIAIHPHATCELSRQMFLPNISDTWMLHKEKMSDLPISMQNTNP